MLKRDIDIVADLIPLQLLLVEAHPKVRVRVQERIHDLRN
jgi:hypothetical protein